MSISALIDESAPTSNESEISPPHSQQRYQHDQYQHPPMQEDISHHVGNAIDINVQQQQPQIPPANNYSQMNHQVYPTGQFYENYVLNNFFLRYQGTQNLSVNTTAPKIPQKEPRGVGKRNSPHKRRPSDANDFGAQKTKVPRTTHSLNHYHSGAPPSSAVGGHRLNELVEHLGEDRKYHYLEPYQYNGGQSLNETVLNNNIGNRFITKDSSSYPLTKPTIFSQCDPNNHRALKSSPPMPSQPTVNGFSHVSQVGGVGSMEMTPPLPSQSMHHAPTPNGQIPTTAAVSSQFTDKYNLMKNDPKLKRNAAHAYITYLIYTNQMMERERVKDNISQPPPHHPSRHQQTMLNGSSSINNVDHHHTITNSPTQMVTHHSAPPPPNQVNGGATMYGGGSRIDHQAYLPPPSAVNPAVYHDSAVHRRASEPVQQPNSNPVPVAARNHNYSSHHQLNNNPPTPSSNVLPQAPPPPLPPSNSRHSNIPSHNSSPNLHPIHSPSVNSHHQNRTHSMPDIRAAMPESLNNNRQSTATIGAGGGHINQQPPSHGVPTLPPIQPGIPPHHQPQHHHHPPSTPHPTHHHHHRHYVHDGHANNQQHSAHSHHYHQSMPQNNPPPSQSYISPQGGAPISSSHSSYNKAGGSTSIPHSPSMGPVITSRVPPSGPPQTNHYQQSPPQQSSNGNPRLPSVGLTSHHHPHLSETGVNGNPPQPSPIGIPREPYLRDQPGYVGNGHQSHHLHQSPPNIPHPGPPVGAGVGPGNGPIQRGGGGSTSYYH
ncbi:10461_t:CDS:10 [Ambispora gerdemannii]|uniref:10461_t:CDS:1 n=1 Tax=Ambispora gerdemannii TaxID=144530 RepID=A0A9N9FHM1_9GLOM|nr:10461_t:CDS:10 [Ambispora gerdemannii]